MTKFVIMQLYLLSKMRPIKMLCGLVAVMLCRDRLPFFGRVLQLVTPRGRPNDSGGAPFLFLLLVAARVLVVEGGGGEPLTQS